MGRRTAVGLIVMVVGLICAVGAVAAAVPTIVTFGPSESEHAQRPATIYLSADAGPEFVHIRWTGWGTAKAIGRGTLDQGQTSGGGSSSATLTLTGLHACKSGANRTYASGSLVSVVKGKRTVLRFPQYAPIAYCR